MKPNDLTRNAWLALLRQGGWWTAGELGEYLGIPKGSVERQLLSNGLRGMVDSGAVSRRNATHPQFAVLPGCSVPRGMTVGEVQL